MTERKQSDMKVILEFRQRIGQALRKYRKSSKLTQNDLARYTGFARTTIIAIENGTQATTVDQLVTLAIVLRRSISDFIPTSFVPPDDWLKLWGPSKLL